MPEGMYCRCQCSSSLHWTLVAETVSLTTLAEIFSPIELLSQRDPAIAINRRRLVEADADAGGVCRGMGNVSISAVTRRFPAAGWQWNEERAGF